MKKNLFFTIVFFILFATPFFQIKTGYMEFAKSTVLPYTCAAVPVGYFFYKMGLMVQYAYDVSKEIYHTDSSSDDLPDSIKKELDTLFSSPRVQDLISKYNKPYYRMWGTLDRSTHPCCLIFKELGFEKLSSSFTVDNNEVLNPYILKMPTNYRLKTAKAIEFIIESLDLKCVAVPKKYSYRLPNTDLNIVVSEKISKDKQIARDLSEEEIHELLSICILLNYVDIPFSDFKPDNFIMLEDKLIIIDTESTTGKKFIFDQWPVHFWGQSKPNAEQFITRLETRFKHPKAKEYQEYWEQNKDHITMKTIGAFDTILAS